MKVWTTVFALTVVLSRPVQSAETDHLPQLTKAQAIEIANAAARKSGIDLSEFQAPEAEFEPVRKDWIWFVFYQGVVLYPDNFLSVHVDDRTRDAQVHRGP